MERMIKLGLGNLPKLHMKVKFLNRNLNLFQEWVMK